MRYYIVSLEQDEVHTPVVTNWYSTIPVQSFYNGKTWEIPFRNLLRVKDCGWEPRYLKLLFSPFPLIHYSLLPVFEEYGLKYISKQMILLDIAYKKSELYYLLLLYRIEGSSIERGEAGTFVACNQRDVTDLDAFYILDNQKCSLVCSLALIESLLREGLVGIHLEPIEIKEEEVI